MDRNKRQRKQRGMSLVELMVGVAIGLTVVAAASLAVSSQLTENRRLLVETQLQQDLRAASDIIARELRRSGAQRDLQSIQGVWRPGVNKTLLNRSAIVLDTATAGTVIYRYQPTTGLDTRSGFSLQNGIIKQLLFGQSFTWQDLTDGGVMKVTNFTITPNERPAVQLACPKLCPAPAGGTACWPSVKVKELTVSITAESKSFPEVQRTLVSTVRVRNDLVEFSDPANSDVCPP